MNRRESEGDHEDCSASDEDRRCRDKNVAADQAPEMAAPQDVDPACNLRVSGTTSSTGPANPGR